MSQLVEKNMKKARKLYNNGRIELTDYNKRIDVQFLRLSEFKRYTNKVIEHGDGV